MELADDHSFGSIDDKSALGRHQGNVPHKHLFFFLYPFVFQSPLIFVLRTELQSEPYMKRSAKSQPLAEALQPTYLRLANLVRKEIQIAVFFTVFDGENILKHGLKANIAPLQRINVFPFLILYLQKFPIRIHLDFDQIGRFNYFLNLAKINPLNFLC